MIRAIFFALVSFFAVILGFSLKSQGNVWCLAAFAVSVLSLFAMYFSLESFYNKKNFWKAVNYS